MKRKTFNVFIIVWVIVLVSLACATPFSSEASVPLQLTQSALSFQATSLSLQSQQATLDAAKGIVPEGAATFTPLPTLPPPPTEAPTEPPTAVPTEDLALRMKKANVLIFEDIWGYTPLSGNRRVSMAVDGMGFSGGRVVNNGDAYGNFKSELTGSTSWDLIVISAESRAGIRGEFWDYVSDQLHRGAGVVAEVYNLDNIANGRIAPLLEECGISFQKDWYRKSAYDVLDYSILLLEPNHPIFNNPNSNISLVTPNPYWVQEDVGDFMRLSSTGGGDAQLLAGLYQSHKSDYGLLATCMQGRFVLQTFGTHDYRQDQTVPLWENMMTYALSNHYKYMDSQGQ